jgi:medium-chain acyl-[acyl-carrier-protein] hydrolase
MTKLFTVANWVSCPRPNPLANLRLFCFPYAGGGALTFRTWCDRIPATVELCSVELPGRGTRLQEPLFTRLTPLVEAIAPALLPYLDKPFAFFGHSMGAMICFELTRLLRLEYNIIPVHLFVSGRRAPQIPNQKPPIHALPEALFIEELRRLNGTPEAVLENRELMELVLPILRADFAIVETYTYINEPALECPITVFGGLQDREVERENLEAWQEQTRAAFALQMFPGDHFFLNSAQAMLLESLGRSLGSIKL